MCRVGDIIVIKKYVSHGKDLSRHSFVVLSEDEGEICGLEYNLVCNVMSSFHSEEHRKSKMRFPGNLEYSVSEEMIKNGHGRSGFIKADQLYYFDRRNLDYYVIGNVSPELFIRLTDFIRSLESTEAIIDNLKPKDT